MVQPHSSLCYTLIEQLYLVAVLEKVQHILVPLLLIPLPVHEKTSIKSIIINRFVSYLD